MNWRERKRGNRGIEREEVDRAQKQLVWYTRNIGLTVFMATVERVTLSQGLASMASTSVRKQCWIDSSIVGFRSAIKKFGVDRYKKNCGPATQGMQMVIEEKLARDSKASQGESEGEIKSGQNDSQPGGKSSQGQIYQAVKMSLCEAAQEIT